METVIGISLALPLGVWLGYRWRDRISQRRRAQYFAERSMREALERKRNRKRKALKVSSGNIIDFVSRISTEKNPAR